MASSAWGRLTAHDRTGQRGERGRARPRRTLRTLPFLTPWLVGVACLVAVPLGLSVYWSFTSYNLLTSPHWVGLANYESLFHDPVFWLSVRNTLYIVVIGGVAGIVMGLGTALLLNKPGKAVTFYRSAIFIPAVVPVVSMVIAWVWILNPDYGLLNGILHLLHLPTFGWLDDPGTAKISLLMIILWGAVGQIMLTFLAALKEVPQDYYDAAAVDGAGAWQQFRRITLPMLRPVLLYNVVIAVVFYSQMFEQAFVASPLDLGAPVNSTLFYSLYLYQNAFTYLQMGRAAAMACLLLVFSALAGAGYLALTHRYGHTTE
jgi:multiple sugar transport system permease protein